MSRKTGPSGKRVSISSMPENFLTAICDWNKLIRQSYEHLKPGGWLELSATIPDIRTDDDSIPKDSAYVEAGRIFFEMATKMGTPLEAPRSWKEQVERNGFVDVNEVVYKLPMGPWPKDKRLKEIKANTRSLGSVANKPFIFSSNSSNIEP
jgi:hypothetical protein